MSISSQLVLYLHNLFHLFFRDFATANMIGTAGLLGKSWPDLDMLPLGWLTDPGYTIL